MGFHRKALVWKHRYGKGDGDVLCTMQHTKKAHNTSLSREVMSMFDKATLDILSELKLDELGNIVRIQDSVPEYISMPFD